MITVVNARIYTMNSCSEIAHEMEYSEGTIVRAVVSTNQFIRKEWKDNGVWKMVGKPYIVSKDKKRAAEKIVDIVNRFLAK